MTSNIVHLTDDTFEEEVLNSEAPVLVDYWAEWCGPCKAIASIVDEIAEEYAGKLKVAKLNIDENNSTPPRYGIRGIPTLMLFKGGSVEATKVGAVSKTQLSAFISRPSSTATSSCPKTRARAESDRRGEASARLAGLNREPLSPAKRPGDVGLGRVRPAIRDRCSDI